MKKRTHYSTDKNLSLVLYNNNDDIYITQLNNLIDDIKILNWISTQFKLNKDQRDFVVEFKKFSDKEMSGFNETIFENNNVGKWYNYIFTLNNYFYKENKLLLVNDYNFKKSLYIFWRMIANNLDSNTWFRVGFKVLLKLKKESVQDSDTVIIRTISPLQNYNNKCFKDCYEIFVRYIEQMSENYQNFDITSIIFPFCINKDNSILNKKIESEPDVNENLKIENIERIKNKLKLYVKNIPITTDLNKWGEIKIIKGSYPYKVKDLINNISTKIHVEVKNKQNNYIVEIKGIIYNNKEYIIRKVSVVNKIFKNPSHEFIDVIENSLNTFTRIINDQLIVYKNNELVYTQNRHKTSYFTKVKKCHSVSTNFITMDLETKSINGKLEPYCICIFDGKKSYSFYITDFSSSDEMVKSALKFLMKRKYFGYIIYLSEKKVIKLEIIILILEIW